MKNLNVKILFLIILILCLSGIFFEYFWKQPKTLETKVFKGIVQEISQNTFPIEFSRPNNFSERAEKFLISGEKNSPSFTKELIIDPFEVKNGERQYFSIWVSDSDGIEIVTATIKTDTLEKTLELRLVEGTKTEGRWVGFWVAKDITNGNTYSTIFKAINQKGQETKLTASWYCQEE